ncbi:unnamed protein product [Pocillopora meandrina]|uniref:Uncharacterized protein n=1 Tax=Pocillopora meandrina TaxID=46732 RepID=A0AAU9XT06_9CNID|nr:unnamed protein product [Pocillopora meandrina]
MNHAFLQQVLARLYFSSDFCWWVWLSTAAGSLCSFTQKARMPPLPSLILPGSGSQLDPKKTEGLRIGSHLDCQQP